MIFMYYSGSNNPKRNNNMILIVSFCFIIMMSFSCHAFMMIPNKIYQSHSSKLVLQARKSTIPQQHKLQHSVAATMLGTSIAISTVLTPTAQAYDQSDYASDTVQAVVQSLKDASGNIDATYKVYEEIYAIITEGKGVGGSVNYQGVALDRGYVADEDTSIYNPGLFLLTESEKERLVEGIVSSRTAGLQKGQWSEMNESAFAILKQNLDPYHMKELSGYLGIVPFYGAFLYLGALAVQQFARDLFPTAYLVGAAAFFLPIIALIAFG